MDPRRRDLPRSRQAAAYNSHQMYIATADNPPVLADMFSYGSLLLPRMLRLDPRPRQKQRRIVKKLVLLRTVLEVAKSAAAIFSANAINVN